tara:strand:+ start:319 stop:495 length:177 start_codon:yes stop_codon:yes gene_type:complete
MNNTIEFVVNKVLQDLLDELKEWSKDCAFESPEEAIDGCRQLIIDTMEGHEEQKEGDS